MINLSNLAKPAIITKEKTYSYQELESGIRRFSQMYDKATTNRIAVFAENRPEWIFAFQSGWVNDCEVVPIDFMAADEDVAYILNDCKPQVIFTSNEKGESLRNALDGVDYAPKVLNFDTLEEKEYHTTAPLTFPTDIEQTATIIYTSGTTGNPKGVMLSYKNLLANINAVTKDVPIYNADRQVLVLLPLHHIFPLLGTMVCPLSIGATVVMSPSMQSADLMETLKNNKVAIFIGVPRLYELMYKGIKGKIDGSKVAKLLFSIAAKLNSKAFSNKIFKKVHESFGGNIKYMVSGGAALNTEVGGFFQTIGFDVLEGFGMTESAPMITFTRPGKVVIGSAGQILPNLQVETRDGEIVAKGPSVMKGYLNRPEETGEVLKDGWLYTGDLGHIDENGYLWITGRKKEIIVLSNGKNINPVELETKLENMCDFIHESAVFMHNEQLHALIVPDYQGLAEKEIKDLNEYFKNEVFAPYNQAVSYYKKIMKFTLINEDLPRTRLGKIQRFRLHEFVESLQKNKEKVEDPKCEEYQLVKSFIESQVNGAISPNDHLEFDIALDSLGKIGLVDYIEKTFGVKIEEDRLLKFPNVKKMVEYIRENKLFQKEEQMNWSEILKEKVHLKLPKGRTIHYVSMKFTQFLFTVLFKLKGKGQGNIPDGPCIIAPNHQSFFDGMFVASFIKHRTMRKTYFYAKKKHVKGAFLRFLARKNNIIVMDINKNLKESIQKLAEVLKAGKKVIIFPEGTRTKTGDLGEFKKMFAILSKELGVPVVPVAINGAYKALPTGKKFPKLWSAVSVEFLQPVYPDNQDYGTLTDEVKENIQMKIE
jgi:long-chain acyl-CoA synthetase